MQRDFVFTPEQARDILELVSEAKRYLEWAARPDADVEGFINAAYANLCAITDEHGEVDE